MASSEAPMVEVEVVRTSLELLEAEPDTGEPLSMPSQAAKMLEAERSHLVSGHLGWVGLFCAASAVYFTIERGARFEGVRDSPIFARPGRRR